MLTGLQLKAIIDDTRTIEDSLMEVRILAELGSVNTAVTEYLKIRQAKMHKEDMERQLKNLSDTQGPSGHQKLQVCDVCGAYLSRLDNDRRLADHFFGKMHIGFATMRKTHAALKEQLRDKKPPPRDDYSLPPQSGGFEDNRYDGRGSRGGFRGAGRGGFRGGRGGPRW